MGRKRQSNKTSWTELILFVLVILCVYFILALFDSSFTGDSGRAWGKYLRDTWGGSVIVLLLFWLYVCVAKFLKLHIPRLPRQVLGTIQLYISFAFMLGLLKETGWESNWTLLMPGSFGYGLAHFFVLNIGTFITLLLVIGSFIFSAFLYGSRVLRLSLPAVPKIKFNPKITRPRRTRRPRRREEIRQEEAMFTHDIPTPRLAGYDDDYDTSNTQSMLAHDIPAPKLKPSGYDDYEPAIDTEPLPMPQLKPYEPSQAKQPSTGRTIDIIDNALAIIDSVPEVPRRKKHTQSQTRQTRTRRRPLQPLSLNEELQYYSESLKVNNADDEPVFPPPLDLFGPPAKTITQDLKDNKENIRMLEKLGKAIVLTLKNFGISASIAGTSSGPSVMQYQLELAPGTKVSKISGLGEELAMALAVTSLRIEAPILGTHYVGVEVPAHERKIVPLRNILESQEFEDCTARLPLPLGVRIDGSISVQGLEEMPHIIIAGNSGSGKNTFLNSCILSMCSVRRPEELKLILIDPGHVEFAVYDGLPHLLSAPVNDADGALKALKWAFAEMEDRTSKFARSKVRSLAAYNRKQPRSERLPEIVIVIEELADLIYSDDIEGLLVRLASKSGPAGIYMMLATQRPSPDVVTTLVKSNIPARAAFSLSSPSDSKNMINITDASELTGKGDMLFRNRTAPQPSRLQTAYIEEERIADFVEYMSSNLDVPDMIKF